MTPRQELANRPEETQQIDPHQLAGMNRRERRRYDYDQKQQRAHDKLNAKYNQHAPEKAREWQSPLPDDLEDDIPAPRPKKAAKPDKQPEPTAKQSRRQSRKQAREEQPMPREQSRPQSKEQKAKKKHSQLGRVALAPYTANKYLVRGLGTDSNIIKAVSAGVIATEILVAAHAIMPPEPAKKDIVKCDDASHEMLHIRGNDAIQNTAQLIIDTPGRFGAAVSSVTSNQNTRIGHYNRTPQQITNVLQRDRGYSITVERFKSANPSLFQAKDSDKLIDGAHCASVPGPIPYGTSVADGKETVADYEYHFKLSKEEFLELNPGFKSKKEFQDLIQGDADKKEVPAGTVIKWTKNINTNILLQPSPVEHIGDLVHDQKSAHRLAELNTYALLGGDNMDKGSPVYLRAKQTPYMVKHHLSTLAITGAFAKQYQHIPKTQTIQPKEKFIHPKVNQESVLLQKMERFGTPEKYAKLYIKFGHKYHVDPVLLAVQGRHESAYNPTIRSSAGAIGIAQFMPDTWKEWVNKIGLPHDAKSTQPKYAIEAQAAYMSSLLKAAKESGYAGRPVALALAGYNAGFPTVNKYHGVPPYSQTENYIKVITESMHYLRSINVDHGIDGLRHVTARGEHVPESVRGTTYFSQSDYRWANVKYNGAGGSTKTLERSGCGPTSLAMVVSSLKGFDITPKDIAEYNMKHGYVTSSGATYHSALSAVPEHFGLRSHLISRSVESIRKVLNEGGLVISNGTDTVLDSPATPGGHLFVINKISDDGKHIWVADPYSYNNSKLAFPTKSVLEPSSAMYGVTH